MQDLKNPEPLMIISIVPKIQDTIIYHLGITKLEN